MWSESCSPYPESRMQIFLIPWIHASIYQCLTLTKTHAEDCSSYFKCFSQSRSIKYVFAVQLTSTSRPILAMWGEDSPTVSSFSVCKKKSKQILTGEALGRHCHYLSSWASYLSRKAAPQVHSTGTSFGCLEPQHDSGGEFIVSRSAAGLLLHREHLADQQLWNISRE